MSDCPLVAARRTPPFGHWGRGLPRVLWIVALGFVTSGCRIVTPELINPLPGVRTVAVAPFFNQSQEVAVDGRHVALIYASELQKVPGFEVVPVGVTEVALREHELDLVSPADAVTLARLLGVDAIVVGSVTHYEPYYPPRIGLAINWYSPLPLESARSLAEMLTPELEILLPPGKMDGHRSRRSEDALPPAQPPDDRPPAQTPVPPAPLADVPIIRGQNPAAEAEDAGPAAASSAPEDELEPRWIPLPSEVPAADGSTASGMPADEPAWSETAEPVSAPVPDDATARANAPAAVTESGEQWPPSAFAEVAEEPPVLPPAAEPLPHAAAVPLPPPPIANVPRPFDPHEPLFTLVRLFDGADERLICELEAYVAAHADLRSGGWQALLRRSDDFTRFAAHRMVVEMLAPFAPPRKAKVEWRRPRWLPAGGHWH
ncbi:MAG: hypothetical protein KY476_09565 [Planctomycetes bacterium]|nr:hypothetical protein [Planctomycetota bacterium]